eukprot:CAMPEP_0197293104 /NCGR_PEP_ID=MMETSP0890-20130614/26798_1 /TAXON_ID=44058 ORGANISM="Aureoumbra lagunensis, Strain CCMP1510" /NCGR_SAMPLE_ID=MMETSP0890 /ASSEMBLY_ACC=CAM_ASM_000533 /LENGTH=388 /DNA_ID=CAMNT_0042767559 /DNA_START=74 /DNA_END=1237 /DNA_ORIENTATION=-
MAEDTTIDSPAINGRRGVHPPHCRVIRHDSPLMPFEVEGYGSPCSGEEEGLLGIRGRKVLNNSLPMSRIISLAALSLGAAAMIAVVFSSIAGGHVLESSKDIVLNAEIARRTQLTNVRYEGYPMSLSEEASAALLGVDLVAYFEMEAGADPIFGSPEYQYTLKTSDINSDTKPYHTTFYFTSAAHRDAFAENPQKYAPRFGGFCSYGISSEMTDGWNSSMDSAGATDGWPWSRDHLGPPANLKVWRIINGKLYFAFLQEVMDVFEADYDSLSVAGEKRWAEWFGSGSDIALAGPFNMECNAKGYGPPVERTCTFKPQTYYHRLQPEKKAIADPCTTLLMQYCGNHQGDDPVNSNACSTCLDDNFHNLKDQCAHTDDALHASIDKAFCW